MLLDLLPLSFPGLGGHAVAQAGCGGLLLDLYGTTCPAPVPVVVIPIASAPGIGLPARRPRRRLGDDDWLAILLALADDDALA